MKNPLEAYRKKIDVNYDSLAKLLDCSRSQAHAWSTGRALPRDEQADKIEKITGVSYSDLRNWKRRHAAAEAATAPKRRRAA